MKDSVHRNLTIILFKRLFKDENEVPTELMRKLTSALSSVERLNAEVYRTSCDEKLSDILAGTNDTQLKRLIPALRYKPDLWQFIEEATQQRLEQIIGVMETDVLIASQIVPAAEEIHELNTYLQSAIQDPHEGFWGWNDLIADIE